MIELIIIAILVIIIILLTYKLSGAISLCEFNNQQYARWENEYWRLRTGTKADERYVIRLSWLTYGTDNCINEKNQENRNG